MLVLGGAISAALLPVAQFPELSPPTVMVTANYPGADASTVAKTVASPIEEQINGAEGMIYMKSHNASNGQMNLTVTFEIGRSLDMAQVDVQNRSAIAQPQLPDMVKRTGVTVLKKSTYFVILVNLISEDEENWDEIALGNYAQLHLTNELARIPGVAQATLFGQPKYAMRVWLDPLKMAALDLTANDIINAVKAQNQEVPAGKLGQPPAPPGQQVTITLQVAGRLKTAEEFSNIILVAKEDGSVVKIKDVGRVVLGAQDYSTQSRYNGIPTAAIGVFQLPGGNALEVADGARAVMKELGKKLPPGVKYEIKYDTTLFVRQYIEEVIITLIEAFFLVFAVTYLFLQDLRATLIPIITIPVSLLGTFILMTMLGFSTNSLTLFGLILAIGLVVDDAIIVVENVQRNLNEVDPDPTKSAIKAMDEVAGPIIATGFVLTAVFVGAAMMPGLIGRMYNQFALTIAASMWISTLNALTLSPALCRIFLRKADPDRKPWFQRVKNPLMHIVAAPFRVCTYFFHGVIFRGFNWSFGHVKRGYDGSIGFMLGRKFTIAVFFIGILGGLIWGTDLIGKDAKAGFIPAEDQGYFMVSFQTDPGMPLDKTLELTERFDSQVRQIPGVATIINITGYNLFTQASQTNAAGLFVVLEPWEARTVAMEKARKEAEKAGQLQAAENGTAKKDWGLKQDAFTIIDKTQVIAATYASESKNVLVFNAPPVPGLSVTAAMTMEYQKLNLNTTLNEFSDNGMALIDKMQQSPVLTNVFTTFSTDYAQMKVDLKREAAVAQGINIGDAYNTIATFFGSYYVNDFNIFGRTYRVILQAEAKDRAEAKDFNDVYVQAAGGKMAPLSNLITIEPASGADVITRYNLYETIEINASPAAGHSQDDATLEMERLATEASGNDYGYQWTDLVYQAKQAGNLQLWIFAISILAVYLVLCALYESWAMPLMIVLAVPTAIFGALTALVARDLPVDVYGQIGFTVLVGLACKNAILIVEFAKDLHDEGMSPKDAVIRAAELRFRPILMTSLAFILAVVPMVLATGPGSNSRHSLGTTVFGGMLGTMVIGVFLVPVSYLAIELVREAFMGKRKPIPKETPE